MYAVYMFGQRDTVDFIYSCYSVTKTVQTPRFLYEADAPHTSPKPLMQDKTIFSQPLEPSDTHSI